MFPWRGEQTSRVLAHILKLLRSSNFTEIKFLCKRESTMFTSLCEFSIDFPSISLFKSLDKTVRYHRNAHAAKR